MAKKVKFAHLCKPLPRDSEPQRTACKSFRFVYVWVICHMQAADLGSHSSFCHKLVLAPRAQFWPDVRAASRALLATCKARLIGMSRNNSPSLRSAAVPHSAAVKPGVPESMWRCSSNVQYLCFE